MTRTREVESSTPKDSLAHHAGLTREGLMAGRRFCSEDDAARRGFASWQSARRRAVLQETIRAFECAQPPGRYHILARENLERWREAVRSDPPEMRVELYPGDWGEVALTMTRTYGTCFAILNMANAHVPGGAYVEGAPAQEENMFRRTDCHFAIDDSEYDSERGRYNPALTALISAREGLVYLDVNRPRVCIRGPEDRSLPDLGYRWLADGQIFPFYELRAAAEDLRDGSPFNPAETRRRIAAQLDTLCRYRIRHAVFSAFGCGAFRNPANEVAALYRDEIRERRADFDVIAFAIYHPGYGPDNFASFVSVFRRTP